MTATASARTVAAALDGRLERNNNDAPHRMNPSAAFAFIDDADAMGCRKKGMSKNQPASTRRPTPHAAVPASTGTRAPVRGEELTVGALYARR